MGALPVGAVGALLRWLLGVAAVVRGRSTVAVVGTGGVSRLRGRGGVAAVCAAAAASVPPGPGLGRLGRARALLLAVVPAPPRTMRSRSVTIASPPSGTMSRYVMAASN